MTKSLIVGIVGFISCGKGTVGDILVKDHNCLKDSFAAPLKDAVSAVFGWDRALLEGETQESRDWREQVDEFWSTQLDRPNFTPRLALQLAGTEGGRNIFGQILWTASFTKRVFQRSDAGLGTVAVDVRFDNEIDTILSMGGTVIRVKRGEDPSWYTDALIDNENIRAGKTIGHRTPVSLENVHASERAWIGTPGISSTIDNDGSLEDLTKKIDDYVKSLDNIPNP